MDKISCRLIILDEAGSTCAKDVSGKLPEVLLSRKHHSWSKPIIEAVKEKYSLDIKVLRTLSENKSTRMQSCELLKKSLSTSDLIWHTLDSAGINIDSLQDSNVARSTPWVQPGQSSEAENWVSKTLSELNISQIGRLIQHRVWSVSYVAYTETDIGRIWFKASPAHFAAETTISHWVSFTFPKNSPRVIALDQTRNWMLMRSFGTQQWDNSVEKKSAESYLKTLAQLQRDSALYTEDLTNIGLPIKYPSLITNFINSIRKNPANLQSLVGTKIMNQIRSVLPELEKEARFLESSIIPTGLEHGDLDSGNVFIQCDNPIFTDWSDSSISHPFYTLASFWGVKINQGMITSSYLDEWAEYGSRKQLLNEYKSVGKTAAAYRSASYLKLKDKYPTGSWWELEPYLLQLLRLIPSMSPLYEIKHS